MNTRSVLEFSPGAAGPLLGADDSYWDWSQSAECQYVGGDLWFPEKGGPVREAKRICGSCAVRGECLEYAIANGIRFGIWGGKSEVERRRILRARRGGPVPLCKAGLHLMAGDNILAHGECLGCRRDREARQRLATAA